MSQQNGINSGDGLIELFVRGISEETAVQIALRYGGEELNKIFENDALMQTCLCLLENDLNVSKTSTKLYMHRNTLIYSINKIRKKCGLDLCKFSDAVSFLLLYTLKKGKAEGGKN